MEERSFFWRCESEVINQQKWLRLWLIILGNIWICATVFFGPLWDDLIRRSGNDPNQAQTWSLYALALSFFLFSFLLKQSHIKPGLYTSFGAALVMIVLMWFWPVVQRHYVIYLFLGSAAGLCILSYTRTLIYGFPNETKTEITALFMLLIAAIQYGLKYAALVLGPSGSLGLVILSIAVAIYITWRFKPGQLIEPATLPAYRFPWGLILCLGLVITVIYLNLGVRVNLMYRPLENLPGIMNYLELLPDIFICLVIYLFFRKLNPLFLLYFCMIILGMAYISYMIAHGSNTITLILLQISSILSDLFIAIYGASVALTYGRDYKVFWPLVFSLGLGIMVGQFAGLKLQGAFGQNFLSTIGVCLFTLLFSLGVIPWLFIYIQKQMKQQMQQIKSTPKDSVPETPSLEELATAKMSHAAANLPPNAQLTPREMEIAILLLERYDQETIAERLFISKNTLKTHISHIYQKFQVSRKKEFIDQIEKQYAARGEFGGSNEVVI